MVRVYGQDMGGFSFQSSSKQQLKDESDSFIETMWTQVKQIATDNGKLSIDKESVEEWKRRNDFKLRRKLSTLSLCRLFEDSKKQNPQKYILRE